MNPPPSNPAVNQRFTIDGSHELEARLAQTCEGVTAGVQKIIPANELEAIALGGGYGRGQGGVLKTEAGDQPYNDLEFYVFVRGNTMLNDQRFRNSLAALGDELSPEAGLHVEFKIIAAEQLRQSSVTMFSYDLAAGHRMVFGDEEVFAGCEAHRAAEKIPLHEATRLLFNRCSGLLFAADRFRKPALTPDDVDFIGRNTAKAQLGLGDAVLTVFGQYDWNVLERQTRLEKLSVSDSLPWLGEIARHHAAGVEFKLHPRRSQPTNTNLRAKHAEISALAQTVWRWLENRRLGTQFRSVQEYALNGDNKCPETSALKNCLLNLRTFRARMVFHPALGRYPRERLLRALPLLLWHADEVREPALRDHLREQLVTGATEWAELLAAYTRLWQRYS